MHKQQFIEACRRGGQLAEQALRTLYRDYGAALRREAWLALHDVDAAAELLQETLLKAWQRCAGYRGESELLPWLRQIVRRGAIDELRRRRPEQSLDAMGDAASAVIEDARRAEPDPVARPDDALQQAQHERVYRRCAERFAAEQPQAAEVIRWVAEDGLQIAELATLLQRSPAATREHVSQCRKKARRYFADWYALVAAAPGAGGP